MKRPKHQPILFQDQREQQVGFSCFKICGGNKQSSGKLSDSFVIFSMDIKFPFEKNKDTQTIA